MFSSVAFSSPEAFSPERVGAASNFEAITTHRGRTLLVPARLRAFLRFWFAEERIDASPCGFAILDPAACDCRADLQSGAVLLWWGSWSEAQQVRAAIETVMADEQLPGRWRVETRRGVGRGIEVLRDDRRGRAAQPRETLALQPRRTRVRPVAATSKYRWETHQPGEERPFIDVTNAALHSHFRAWARRRGVQNRAIKTRTLMPGVIGVTMVAWHGGDDALLAGAPAAVAPACPHCGHAL